MINRIKAFSLDKRKYKGMEILEGYMMPGHVHMLVAPKPHPLALKTYEQLVSHSGNVVSVGEELKETCINILTA
ncbi:hypothetical protein P4H57_06085 [Paenibacillus pabuli]|uniref:transposase n=1 Tax=Paenibacillus pabuli TaxID=1472 RepID=UPI000781CE10|nr:transposase [Paenibacillus pabuli]MEC0124136.1 hypothetical protein [Paenibacillus pabuli]